MQETSLSLGLFDPGMTELHRVGLAGLYMTLKSLDAKKYEDIGSWELSSRRVNLYWKGKPSEFFNTLVGEAFGISSKGLIRFRAHRGHPMGDAEILHLHEALRLTFLQHGKNRKEAKQAKGLQFDYQEKTIHRSVKPVSWYRNQDAAKLILSKSGDKLVKSVELAGWCFPGGAVRHNEYSSSTLLSSPLCLFVPAAFAPVASLYFTISHRDKDGRPDKRLKAAIVLPHITDLEEYSKCYTRFLSSPLRRLHVDSLGDAGLMGLMLLNLKGNMLGELGIESCTVMTFGSIPWSKQQKTRTGMRRIVGVNVGQMNLFAHALASLDNNVVLNKDGGLWIQTSPIRGLIAENIAAGREWFQNFHELMTSQTLARRVSWQRKGLNEMATQLQWDQEADQRLVESVHQALRNRYGAMAKRAQEKGEAPQFGREFERIRTSLMRAKNAQTMRSELADLFARGGLNKSLQQCWLRLLPLFTGDDWQRARDLALLALASYVGQGAETIEMTTNGDLTVEEEE
jgi:CRISPR-associated protein Cas8a1/Csx13